MVLMAFSNSFAKEKSKLTPVKVSFLEALAPKDTTSSQRFQKEYELAIQTGKDLSKLKLEKCGYELVDSQVLYDSSDTLQAMESAKKAQESESWLIVGPRRSNHYLLVAKGAENSSTVSIMASSKEVFELEKSHLTLAQSNSKMAKALAKETKANNKKTYISIVNEDCISCKDMSLEFDKFAEKLKLKKLAELKIVGEQPEQKEIEEFYLKYKPDAILIPNYSKASAFIIGTIYKLNPKVFFVGGDGWGDNKYGFVHNSPQLQKANGITVKGFPPVSKGLNKLTLGKMILSEPSKIATFPESGTALALLKVIEGTSDLLCQFKPKNKIEFDLKFKKFGSKYFENPWGVSLFKLSAGEIIFEKTVR